MIKRIFKYALVLLIVLLVGGFAIGYTPDTEPEAMRAKYAYGASEFVSLQPGLNIHVRDEGKPDGPAIVLIHGSNASLHTWEPWVKRLGTGYRIISLDLPGHGLTGANPSGTYDVASYVGVVDRVLTHFKVEQAVIGGNSMGGGVAWHYALAHPERTASLLLVDAAGAPEAKPRDLPIGFRLARMPVIKEMARYIAPRSIFAASVDKSMSVKTAINDALIDRYWELNRYPGNREATMKRFNALPRRGAANPDQLATIKVPTLILWGEEDNLIPVSAGRWFAKTIPNASLIIYPAVGHIPMEEVADKSAGDVLQWLQRPPVP
jgi:pimeloyl-ACP methyl ester carboxylesterase